MERSKEMTNEVAAQWLSQRILGEEKVYTAKFRSAVELAVDALRRAQHMPEIDAVEVVRCRDCVHFGECLVTENDYCSKGERKENY